MPSIYNEATGMVETMLERYQRETAGYSEEDSLEYTRKDIAYCAYVEEEIDRIKERYYDNL